MSYHKQKAMMADSSALKTTKPLSRRYDDAADDCCVVEKKGSQLNQLSQPFTGAILETIGYIRDELQVTNSNLVSIEERIFGLYDGDEGCDDVGYSGLEARILGALRDLLMLAQENRQRSNNVNTRL